jgi:hypothetical protein
MMTVYTMVMSRLHVLDTSLLQLDKCPVCFGIWEGVCKAITSGTLKVKEEYFWKSNLLKGVRFGIWDRSPVVVKQLGHSSEMALLDQEICLNTTEPVSEYCNVHENVWRSFLNPGVSFKRLTIFQTFFNSIASTQMMEGVVH